MFCGADGPLVSPLAHRPAQPQTPPRARPTWWALLGAGVITGAAGNDPSGIATYAQAGVKYGFDLAWTLLATYPLMVVIQAISGRLGRATGLGIAGNLRRHYPRLLVEAIVAALLIANTVNLGVDLLAMAQAAQLLCPLLPQWLWVVLFGAFCLLSQVRLSHVQYVRLLKWLAVVPLVYLLVAAGVHVPWRPLLRGLLWPRFSSGSAFWLMIVAILGTTISPYLFFWEAAQEVEDTRAHAQRRALVEAPQQGPAALRRIRTDTLLGMGLSNLIGLAILVTGAALLPHGAGGEIANAADAAAALRPVAGPLAVAVFALGIIGSGLLAVPVLAGSAAYAVAEVRRWPVGLTREHLPARALYPVMGAGILIGMALCVSGVSPVGALVWAAFINGIVAIPVLTLLMLMAVNPRILGVFRIHGLWVALGWLATALMAFAAAGCVWSVL